MARPLADYVKLPGLDEYKEWFKDFADLKREDGILQVTWKTLDGPMHHSGMSHRAIPQLVRVLSLDLENEIIIFTHIGDNWMIESDANGWETYSQLPKERFQHQYFDDTNLIKNMLFDLDVPTIGVMPGPGFHWDSAFLSDVTIVTEDTKIEVPHAQGGLVPGDGMGLMMQHYLGTKRGTYYMMTSRQITAQQMLDAGMVSEVVAKGKGLERAWEIARMWKRMPYENRCIMSNLAKRPLKKLMMDDLKLHTVSEQYASLLRVAAGNKTAAGVREQKPGYFPLQKSVRGGKSSLHLVEYHALDGKRVVFVQLVVPALLAENLRLGMEQRMQHRVHVDPQEIDKILAVPAGYRIDGLVREGHGVEESVQGAFHQFHKRFLYRIALRTAQDGMLQNMEYTRVVPGLGLESNAKGLVLLRPLQPDQPGAGFLVLHLPEVRFQFVDALPVEDNKI